MSGEGPDARGDRPFGFHEGELAVQRQAGVGSEAVRLEGMLAPAHLGDGIARFLADRTFAALAARDTDGRLWVSALTGEAGFLTVADPTRLTVAATPLPGDPLHGLPAGQPVGLIVVEFATRRRVRINGTLSVVSATGLTVAVEQAFGNCPQYIQRRTLIPTTGAGPARPAGRVLTPAATDLLRRADTLLVGTVHPTRGADVSHRGGRPGFVRVEGNTLWWPDYRGNNMFTTLGNLAVDPTAALLVPDFVAGGVLQLSGTAQTDWVSAGGAGDDDGTGRLVRFTVDAVATGSLAVRADAAEPYALNPPLTGATTSERARP